MEDHEQEARSVEFIGSFDPNRQALTIDGEGQGKITFYASADQLAKVVTAFAEYSKTAFVVKLEPLPGSYICPGGGGVKKQTYR